MYRSYFDATPYHLLKHRSHSYYVRGGAKTAARFDADTGVTVSNGGLNAPLPDMVRYVNFLLGDPSKQEAYDGVLKRSSERVQGLHEPVSLDPYGEPPGLQHRDAPDVDGSRQPAHAGIEDSPRRVESLPVDPRAVTACHDIGSTDKAGRRAVARS